jgi:hypothetical protein
MENVKMPHPGHDQHLCYLANLGFMLESPEEYTKLVRNSKYMCTNCGRAANKAENLCKPVEL